jgi:hypothetical protein
MATGYWTQFTGYEDPDSKWSGEEDIIDGSVQNAGSCYAVKQTWTSYFIATCSGYSCSSVRWYGKMGISDASQYAQVDVYYSGGWHSVFDGNFEDNTDYECPLGSTQTVTAMRLRFLNDTTGTMIYMFLSLVQLYRELLKSIHFRAYAVDENGTTVYGQDNSFTFT